MKNDFVTNLHILSLQIEALIQDKDAENAIIPGNGYDESMMVGTADSFLRLAKVLIEIVGLASDRTSWTNNDIEEETIADTSVVGTNKIKDVFRESSPVWVMCAYLASDDESAKTLARKLSENIANFDVRSVPRS